MGLTHQPWWWDLNEGERHLSHHLQDAGYATHLFGIQHETRDVTRLAFDHILPQDGQTAPQLGQAFADALPGMVQADRPFFAQIGFFESLSHLSRISNQLVSSSLHLFLAQ